MIKFSKQSPLHRWGKAASRYAACVAVCMACSVQPALAVGQLVTVKATVVDGPRCTIMGNASGYIEVLFGEMRTDMIDGVNYKKPIPVSLNCSGNPSSLRFKFTSAGGAAMFDPTVLATNFSDLGVRLLKPDSTQLNLNEVFEVGAVGALNFMAVPVKKTGANLPTGNFGTSVVLTVEVL
ncbi:fimbrial protein [Pseudomonas sp. 8O]|uniref:fimbrial protein n=1 Tax=Pseudomonas sp. 8O TaxID=2653165 RepID=UPI0012F07952|nr:fimbrial protein [Pseudomonas sp. 8O]VXC36238.1 conserved exported hypothetical protein [Pseudomonas sp. 8O]